MTSYPTQFKVPWRHLPTFSRLLKQDRGTELYDEATGIEADLCKAIAIAVFGESNSRVYFRNLDMSFDMRVNALIRGDIDIMFRSTAMRGLNNVAKNVDQGPVILFDPIAILLPDHIKSIEDEALSNTRLCMVSNTLPVEVAQTYAKNHNVIWTPVYNSLDDSPLTHFSQAVESHKDGHCNGVLGRFSTLYQYFNYSDGSSELKLLTLGANYHVPTVPLIVENDSNWHDLILQTIWILLDAERKGIDDSNMPPGYRAAHWRRMDLTETNGQAVIKQLGHYGDIYQRNLGELLPERGPNQHYLLSPAGALFSPP